MRVFDVFPFWREAQFVQARHLLWSRYQPDVEHITVACLGDVTHRGGPLPRDLPESRANRIVEVVLDADGDWGRERQQRDAISEHLRQWLLAGEAGPEDIVLLADADELVDPRRLRAIVSSTIYRPCKIGMAMYFYGLEYLALQQWWQASAGRLRDLLNLKASDIRTAAFGYPVVSDAGWHVSYVGGMEAIDQKLSAFAHAEWDTPEAREVHARGREQGLDMMGKPLLRQPMETEIAECLRSIPKSNWS